MLEFLIFVGVIVIFACGFFAGRHEYIQEVRTLRNARNKDYTEGFNNGWTQALRSTTDVKKAFEYHFGRRP